MSRSSTPRASAPLLSYANRARRAGVRLSLVAGEELAQVLQIARLADAFDITTVLAAAG